MGGAVVHARRGERAQYRPIVTPLCAGAAPRDVAAGLLSLAPFRTLYVADLDAIAGRPPHVAALAELAALFDTLWLDAGLAAPPPQVRPVLGTEVMADFEHARRLLTRPDGSGAPAGVLSLDHGPEGPRGPAALHEDAALWPPDVILMTLTRVGSGEGPDFARLEQTLRRAQGRRIYAAGGVRHRADLDRLAKLGVAGVLLASALHDGRLSADDLADFMG